mgnify:CR=1 FL=1
MHLLCVDLSEPLPLQALSEERILTCCWPSRVVESLSFLRVASITSSHGTLYLGLLYD